MKKLAVLFVLLFTFQILDAQTTISVGTGTPVLDGVLSPGEWNPTPITTSLGVTLNAMADGQYLYMAAHWNDTTESIYKNQLSYSGGTWTKSNEEDRIAFIFDMGLTGTDGANCATMCHTPVMSTNSGKADLWHWKAVRSNPMGYIDDTYLDSIDRHSDPGTGAYTDNIFTTRPSFMAITDPHANVNFLTQNDAAFNAFDPYGVMTSHTYNKSVTFDTLATFNDGDFIPGYLLRVPNGDRATVQSAGKWTNGVWTVEFKKPYAGTDFDFAVIPGTSVKFTCEIFDNEGSTHWTNGFDATILTLDFSSIIPVELISFSATANGKEVNLNWSTATELNNYGFEIQRKALGGEFATIAFVKGNGTTTQKNEYSFIEKNIDEGKYFYRLKQIDLDGTTSYSKEVEVIVQPSEFALNQNYPNPFNPSTTINYQLAQKSVVELKVYDMLGKEIVTLVNEVQDAGYYKIQFDAVNYSSGIYFYQIKTGNFTETKRMVLIK
ncbi:MAG: hypothetical protein A2315_01145 [Ignavibacteria bacterium RIFOXYB2_FULL_35_12]|nr:MAG: hypothetical protein A2006_06515 [Ignavibacteria bacterium GWC2_35_8]OGU83992.1 MAG: hypothetical protein A3K31_14200 [Ignavibacteria bacterium RIFOXYA12_FULL_35_25]OGU91960.1 MAG: hypothetical protein A2492_14995 [Ignavibacteria bacterium RIFOXYC12_FULL_35_11]OGU95210.1 MAG: hypothetical protein A2347_03600 [Ignavibacteria bacterium RIFOXYB12_FULL_35_14]OGU99430.1 MAG: hypothetical protein A2455_02990 [Ignavibacteria bacterium RIFOXYC2_FULL_35_16]OGV03101.1 MAG: hypothetical protein A